MADVKTRKTKVADLAWLLNVTESRQSLSESSPIWVREGNVTSGPPVAYPERHPYCEFNIVLEGEGTSLVGHEEAFRVPGDLLLLGPGVPHWGKIKKFPLRSITIYFLPSALIEIGPMSEGIRILRRFTASQALSNRLVRPPKALRTELTTLFESMAAEFAGQGFGRDVQLLSILLTQLVMLLRWEESQGINIGGESLEMDWQPIFKALEYLREHHAEPVYAKDVAHAAGISESRLKILFRYALNLSWVKYLQGYRIHRAAALLSEGRLNVTEAALEVGFDSLSHFNETFHSFMGVSPKSFVRK
jgi:AraC-like DNA-binding protein